MTNPIRAVIIALGLILALAACTPRQVQAAFPHLTYNQAKEISFVLDQAQRRAAAAPANAARWDRVAACESGGRWGLSTGNGYYGGLQFSLGTWRAYGGTGYPHQKSRNDQIRIAEKVRTQSGLGHWGRCGSRW